MTKTTVTRRVSPLAAIAALNVLIAAMAPPAAAQQTPATYCASLAAVSCEVLNVEPIGPVNDGGTIYVAHLIKFCRNQRFETRQVHLKVAGGATAMLAPTVRPGDGNNLYGTTVTNVDTTFAGSTTRSGENYLDFAKTCW